MLCLRVYQNIHTIQCAQCFCMCVYACLRMISCIGISYWIYWTMSNVHLDFDAALRRRPSNIFYVRSFLLKGEAAQFDIHVNARALNKN